MCSLRTSSSAERHSQCLCSAVQSRHCSQHLAETSGGVSSTIHTISERHSLHCPLLLQLLDEGSPFLELSPLAGKDLYGEQEACQTASACSRLLVASAVLRQ